MQNEVKTVVPQCKVILYKWAEEDFRFRATDPSVHTRQLSASTAIDISSKIQNFSYTKTIQNPAGEFSFSLANNVGYLNYKDWRELITPGTWCTIYLSQDGNLNPSSRVKAIKLDKNERGLLSKYLRCVGYIERVAVQSELNVKGGFDVTFKISGRDFGVIYENTNIWLNPFRWNQLQLKAAIESKLKPVSTTPLDELLTILHDLFLAPQKIKTMKLKKYPEKGITDIKRQWLLPSELIRNLNLTTFEHSSYYGSINGLLNFSPTIATISIGEVVLNYLQGKLWSKLKDLSIPEFHELFTELNDSGGMELIFRPTPFALQTDSTSKMGKYIKKLIELKRCLIEPIDIIDFNLGKDNHTRYNHYLNLLTPTIFGVETNINWLKDSGFPYSDDSSITRHGLRPMHTQINSICATLEKSSTNEIKLRGDASAWRKKAVEYNETLYDYWRVGSELDTGTLTKIGSNDIKIGKALQFSKEVPYAGNKLFYIEQYTDEYMIEDRGSGIWLQSIQLTRGADEQTYKKEASDTTLTKTNFIERQEPYEQEGDYTPDKEGDK